MFLLLSLTVNKIYYIRLISICLLYNLRLYKVLGGCIAHVGGWGIGAKLGMYLWGQNKSDKKNADKSTNQKNRIRIQPSRKYRIQGSSLHEQPGLRSNIK